MKRSTLLDGLYLIDMFVFGAVTHRSIVVPVFGIGNCFQQIIGYIELKLTFSNERKSFTCLLSYGQPTGIGVVSVFLSVITYLSTMLIMGDL